MNRLHTWRQRLATSTLSVVVGDINVAVQHGLHTWRQRLFASALELSGLLVVLVISAVGVWVAFGEQIEQRNAILGLSLLLVALELIGQGNRWWRPHAHALRLLLALKAATVVALLQVTPSIGFYMVVFFVLSVQAAMYFQVREWVLWIAGLALLTGIHYVLQAGWQAGVITALVTSTGYFFFAIFAKNTSDAQRARADSERLLRELQEAHRRLQEYAAQVEELAIADERNRLAREMHDTLGHHLTVAAVQLEGAQRLVARDPQRAESMVATVHQQVLQALHELRQTVATLRAPLEEELSLNAALQRLAAQFQQATNIEIDLSLPQDLPHLPPTHRAALFRAAQESLTNVQRHACARHVWLSLSQRNGSILLHVSDDGVGIPPHLQSRGFGLRGLRERASHLGGDFHLAPRPEGGVQAMFHIPLPAENHVG